MYGRIEGVAALVPGVGELSSTSTPTDAQVYRWLEEASVLVRGALAAGGYSTTVAVTAAVMPMLEAMTQLYAAANTLQARGLDTAMGGEENRSEQMFKRFFAMLGLLRGGNLSELGILLLSTTGNPRMRIKQMRRIDGYSATYEGSATEYSYPSE